MNPYSFSLLFFSFCTFLISLFIFFRRRDAVGKVYFIFSVFAAIWAFGVAILLNQFGTYKEALIASRIANAAAVFAVIAWFHFVLVITNYLVQHRFALNCFYLLGCLIDLFAFTPWFVPNVDGTSQFVHYGRPGFIFHIFTCMFYILVVWSFALLFKKYRSSMGYEKSQTGWLIIATFWGFIAAGFTFLPIYEIDVPQYSLFLLPTYPFIMAYVMMRKNLFDIETVIQIAKREKLAAIGTLATSINHEIRNPLYIIQGLAQSHLANLEEGIYKSEKEALCQSSQILSKAVEQAERAMDIMKRFAMFAKQDMNHFPDVEEVKLYKTMANILPLIHHQFELDKIEFVQNISEQLQSFKADCRHIEQILFNLIVNACQAMKAEAGSQKLEAREKQKDTQSSFQPPASSFSKGLIEISAERQNGHINIMVKDNGPGIPKEKISRIFEPFYTTKAEGTGLGLYITKQLVERNGGKISVQSTLGQGTIFKLEFKR